ncbi:AAA family ATPase [Sorangium sp. So ce269]
MTTTALIGIGEARQRAIDEMARILEGEAAIEKAVIGQDLFGLLRVILWLVSGADEAAIRSRVAQAFASCGRFFTGQIWISSAETSPADNLIYSSAWDEGFEVPGIDRLRLDDRTRTRTAWLPRFRSPLWDAQHDWRSETADMKDEGMRVDGPPIVVFYSFKGGVGRTTALAAFAIQRAREGNRVLVIDMDLDAPGAGTLLSADVTEQASFRGVVDYLMEAPLGEVQIDDYVHRCKRESIVGDAEGEIVVMPAGNVDENYLGKLARLDLEIRGGRHPLEDLLLAAREKIEPDWILIDSRAGLSPAAGLLLDGVAHLHVLFGTNSAQSQLGLAQVIRNLGEERILRGVEQANCIVVQAMVVDLVEVEKLARSQFTEWLEPTIVDHYFVSADEDPNDEYWSVRNVDEPDSPSRAVAIPYRPRLAFFPAIDDVANDFVVGPYIELGRRILMQFRVGEDLAQNGG